MFLTLRYRHGILKMKKFELILVGEEPRIWDRSLMAMGHPMSVPKALNASMIFIVRFLASLLVPIHHGSWRLFPSNPMTIVAPGFVPVECPWNPP